MTHFALPLLHLFLGCGSPPPEGAKPARSAPAPANASTSTPFFGCESAVRKEAEASSSGAAKATVDELAAAAEKRCIGAHEPNATGARQLRDHSP